MRSGDSTIWSGAPGSFSVRVEPPPVSDCSSSSAGPAWTTATVEGTGVLSGTTVSGPLLVTKSAPAAMTATTMTPAPTTTSGFRCLRSVAGAAVAAGRGVIDGGGGAGGSGWPSGSGGGACVGAGSGGGSGTGGRSQSWFAVSRGARTPQPELCSEFVSGWSEPFVSSAIGSDATGEQPRLFGVLHDRCRLVVPDGPAWRTSDAVTRAGQIRRYGNPPPSADVRSACVFVLLGKGNDRSRGTRVRLVPGLVLTVTALAAAACGVAVVPGSGTGRPSATAATTAASAHPRAKAELATLLAGVRVPLGSTRVTSPPVAYLAEAPLTEGSPNLLTLTSWWRIKMSFNDAVIWLQTHPPGGLQADSGGQAGGPGVPVNRFLGFSAPSTTAYDGAEVELELVAMSASETGLRADAEVIWLPPKPPDEFVPSGTAVTLIAINHFGTSAATTLRTRHLDSADAAAVIRDLNALLPDDGSTRHCAADDGYRIQIEVTVAGTPTVFSDWWACYLVQVTRGRTTFPTLLQTMPFQNEITDLMGSPPPL